MTNLLAETLTAITNSGHSVTDVVYVGAADGHSCSLEEFVTLADVEYDSGFGAQEVASDLVILFRDGSWLQRDEYDGAESWEIVRPFVAPAVRKSIQRLVRGNHSGWSTLAELQTEEDW